MEEEEEGEKMQANPAYQPIEMNYKSQESKYINVSSWSNWKSVYSIVLYVLDYRAIVYIYIALSELVYIQEVCIYMYIHTSCVYTSSDRAIYI